MIMNVLLLIAKGHKESRERKVHKGFRGRLDLRVCREKAVRRARLDQWAHRVKLDLKVLQG
jgi:hypothetical protein